MLLLSPLSLHGQWVEPDRAEPRESRAERGPAEEEAVVSVGDFICALGNPIPCTAVVDAQVVTLARIRVARIRGSAVASSTHLGCVQCLCRAELAPTCRLPM